MVCHGKCDTYYTSKNSPMGKNSQGINVFEMYGYCRICSLWVNWSDTWGKLKNRCLCCHNKLSTKPRLNSNKSIWRERYEL